VDRVGFWNNFIEEKKFFWRTAVSKIILGATKLEISFLLDELGCRHAGKVQGFDAFPAKHHSQELFVVESGPGMANAAAATALAIERFGAEHIFNVGVCGVYSDDMRMLTRVVAGTAAVFADAGVETDDAFLTMEDIDLPLFIRTNSSGVYNRIGLYDGVVPGNVPRAVFFTLSAGSGNMQRAQKIKGRFKINRASLICEDMETAAVALVACRSMVSCTALRGISNLCGDRDYKRWQLSEAAEAAQQELLGCL